MNKDTIYIDVEDDITAIIGKVKAANQRVVALVPPKRIGVLQSVVNMRLLARAAEVSSKRLVLITSNQALIALAANASIPVAKTLQSKPEMPEIPALSIDNGEEVIDGGDLPVGEHARMAGTSNDDEEPDESTLPAFATVSGAASPRSAKKATPPRPGEKVPQPKSKKGPRIPNFDTFRKKLLLFGGLGVLLIGFGVWAIFFAPRATVIVTAQTTPEVVNQVVSLREGGAVSIDDRALPALFVSEKKTATTEFTATGKKEVGERATGTMTITRDSVSTRSQEIPAGTGFSSGDYTFLTTESVVIPRSEIVGEGSIDTGSATVGVRANEIGAEYNLNARSYSSSISGYSGQGSEMTGGSSEEVTVVSQEDIDKALQAMDEVIDPAMQEELKKQLGDDVTAIEESYTEAAAAPVAQPKVGERATKAELNVEVTYTLAGVANADLSSYLNTAIKQQIEGRDNQHIYDNGLKDITFAQFEKNAEGASVQLTANGQTGPKIDEDAVKEQIQGSKYGEVQNRLEAIDGISDVDVKFWPFWVGSVPNNPDRITIEFTLDEK